MTKTRLISAFVLMPVLGICVQTGGWLYFTAIMVITLLGTWEFNTMMQVKGHRPQMLLSLGFALIPLLSMQFAGKGLLVPAFSLLVMASLVWQLFREDSESPVVDWALTIVGGSYVGLGMGHFLVLREVPDGIAWVWVTLLGTWGCDTFAYFVGKSVGKHKFWPRLSPKKTWEGIFGGVLGGIFGASLAMMVFHLMFIHVLVLGILISIVAPLGDISISMMKRYAGVKDSSHLIPGHGGMLDRIDSILFVVVVVFYYVSWGVI